MSRIDAVLFDADGVLQHAAHDWVQALDAVGGPGFAEAVFEHELPAMRGEATMRHCVHDAAMSFGAMIDLDDLLDLWRRFTVDDEALAVVSSVREAGVGVFLATNQQDVRRDVMRERYAVAFDDSFYSCELGVAKPDPVFFRRALRRLNVDAGAVVFVDDSPRNIAAALEVGLVGAHHEPSGGAAALREELRGAGIPI